MQGRVTRDANKFLNDRVGHVAKGRIINPRADKVLVAELLDGVVKEYQVNARKSLDRLETRAARLKTTLGHRRAHDLTTQDVEA
ncbi:MAG TPA: hypothetical protein VN648_14495 [Candidatus Methylomirabilis sp.]|nr:hypothetical protein [Candidatus Methylomirabilis sp.]